MPIDPGTTLPIFEGALASHALIGPGSIQLATGCANGLFMYMTAGGCTTISIDVGTLGAGKGTGVGIVLPYPALSSVMSATFLAHLIAGPFSPVTADAISMGISMSLALALVNTINAGVGIGAGKVQCIPTGAGGGIFAAAMLSAGMTGKMVPPLADAIGMALDAVIPTAQGVVVIAGPPNIIPGAGVGVGTVT